MPSDRESEDRVEPRFERADDTSPIDRGGMSGEFRGRPLRHKLAMGLVAAIALTGFAGIAWYATSEGRKDVSDIVPVIRADSEPEKTRPEEPGGMPIPNRERSVFERVDPLAEQPRVERLLPGPEAPLPMPEPQAVPESAGSAVGLSADGGSPTELAAPLEKTPDRSETTEKAPQVTEIPAPPEIPVPRIQAPPIQKEPAEADKPESGRTAVETEPATPSAPSAPVAARTPSTPQPATPQPATPPMAEPYMVQLGAVQDAARARAEAERLNQRFADILGELKVTTVRADLGAKGVFYRLRAGPVDGRAAAESLCARLAGQNQSCLPARP